jgi:hypothetical protein
MAAVTTKKRNGDMAVQLTFPTVFEDVYAAEGPPLEYEPEPTPALPALPEGMDLQADWHRQKLADANRMAMAAVEATKNSERRFLLSHAGYFGMPKPVLGQRIYANPSYGNQADIYSARRDMVGAGGYVGGVLRTAEGQSYGRRLLQARAAQLDAIDAAQAMQAPDSSRLPSVAQESFAEPTGEVPTNLMLEASTIIENIAASAMEGRLGSIDIKDAIRAVQLILRISTSANREEFEGLIEQVENLVENMREIYQDAQDGPPPDGAVKGLYQTTRIVFPLFSQLLKYLNEMSSSTNINRSDRERVAVSRALVKKYQLSNVLDAQFEAFKTYVDEPRRLAAAEAAERARRAAAPVMPPGFAPGAVVRVPRRRLRGRGGARVNMGGRAYAVAPMSSTFSQAAPTREDTEHMDDADAGYIGEGVGKAMHRVRGGQVLGKDPRNTVHFDRDQRTVFGDRSGAYFMEGPAGDYPSDTGMEKANPSNIFRKPLDNTLQPQAQAPLPVFPQGTPDAEASQIDAMATQMQGQGKPKKWIQGVAESMKKGAFTKQALKAHMTPEKFADEVLAHPDKYSLITRRRAQFLKNIRHSGPKSAPKKVGGAKPTAAPSAPKSHGLSRASLPKTREGYMELAEKLKGMGQNLRINKNSKLASIRQNFIRKLGL